MQRVLRTAGILIIVSIIALSASILFYAMPQPSVSWEGTKFIAHRGLSSQCFENSKEAFLRAGKSPFFFGIETDIWLTADGKWLCAHDNDPFVDSGKLISELTADEAATLPLDTSISQCERPIGDTFICTFEKYLEICKRFGKVPVIELKYVANAEEIENLSATVSEVFDIGEVMFISFHAENISLLKGIGARAMRLAKSLSIATDVINSGESVGLNYKKLTTSLLKSAKQKGAEINVYTINNKNTAERFVKLGVDYITTDFIF